MIDLNYLKAIKKQKKITNKQLSESCGIPLGTLNKILSGETELKLSAYEKIKNSLTGKSEAKCDLGMVKVGAFNFDIKLASIGENVKRIKEKLSFCVSSGVSVAVFSELSLTGYTLSDLFYQSELLQKCESALKELKEFSCDLPVVFFVGAPLKFDGKIYNCSVCFCNGKILGINAKKFVPDYNEFYETRVFCPCPEENKIVDFLGEKVLFGNKIIYKNKLMPSMKIGVEICEDLWVAFPPSTMHAINGATISLNLSASNEVVGKADYRKQLICTQSAKNVCCYVYSDACFGESTTDLVFAGHNLVVENGKVLAESKLFKGEDAVAEVDLDYLEYERSKFFKYDFSVPKCDVVEFELLAQNFVSERIYPKTPFVPSDKEHLNKRAELILDMQSYALKRRLEHIRPKSAVIGISGGLDSALALLVTVRAFKLCGKSTKDILAVTMPCFGTTTRTKNNAVKLTELLGVTLKEVDIRPAVLQHFKDIGQDESVTDVTYENSQARERTQVLFDIANKTGGIVIGTGDLSELALGWATYNGDHMSSYSVNCSVPKTLVRHLVEYEAKRYGKEICAVLTDILLTPVSPELIPAENDKIKQKTEDLVGPYVLHDFFLYYFVRAGFSPKKIYGIALRTFKDEFSPQTVLKWLEIFVKRFFSQQFKRSCVPDGVKVGTVSLSPRGDWRMPSDAYCDVWLQEINELKKSVL